MANKIEKIEQKIDRLVQQIENWDMENISVLKKFLDELETAICERNDDIDEVGKYHQSKDELLDFSSLPSAEIPDDIDTAYPVWAMDKQGMCLVGETAQDIEHVDEIRLCYNTNNSKN